MFATKYKTRANKGTFALPSGLAHRLNRPTVLAMSSPPSSNGSHTAVQMFNSTRFHFQNLSPRTAESIFIAN